MTFEDAIMAILDCNFSQADDEIKQAACKNIVKIHEDTKLKGRWITFPTDHTTIQCSECTALVQGYRTAVFMDKVGDLNFCPNCGAQMQKTSTDIASGSLSVSTPVTTKSQLMNEIRYGFAEDD